MSKENIALHLFLEKVEESFNETIHKSLSKKRRYISEFQQNMYVYDKEQINKIFGKIIFEYISKNLIDLNYTKYSLVFEYIMKLFNIRKEMKIEENKKNNENKNDKNNKNIYYDNDDNNDDNIKKNNLNIYEENILEIVPINYFSDKNNELYKYIVDYVKTNFDILNII